MHSKLCIICGSSRDTLHMFPEPNKHIDRFDEWVAAVGGEMLGMDKDYIYRNRRICHKHFEAKYHNRYGKLNRLAVPKLFLGDGSPPVHHLMDHDYPQVHSNPRPGGSSSDILSSHFAGAALDPVPNEEQPVPIAGPSHARAEPLRPYVLDPVRHGMSLTKQYSQTSKLSVQTKDKYCAMRKELINLKKHVSKLNKQKQSHKSIKAQFAAVENQVSERMMEKLSASAKLLLSMQLNNWKKSKKGRRFTLSEKILCLNMWKKSPKAYRFWEKLIIVPTGRTLATLLQKITLTPGLNEVVFENLKKRVAKLPPAQRLCTLVFDEMSVQAGLHYDAHKDRIIGFEDFGTHTTEKFADHVLVFMIRGIRKKFKQSLSYTFCASTTKSPELVRQMKDVVRAVHSTGLKIISCVCDQGQTNVAALNTLINDTRGEYLRSGKEYRGRFFEIDGCKVIPIFDPPHLLKGIRNNLITKNLKFTNEKSKTASWEHVLLLHKVDAGKDEIKLLPKLTDYHVLPEKIPKMKVKYAAQVLSERVSATMRFLAKHQIMPAECEDTAEVLLFFDKLFDSLNSSFSDVKNGKIYRAGLRIGSPHHELWKDSKKILQKMYFVDKNEKRCSVPTVNNWIKTIEGMEEIWKTLHEEHNFNVLLTRHINQDPLENLFGAIRSNGCRNVKPTCAAFEGAYKTLLMNNLTSNHSVGSNCEEDGDTCLQPLRFLIEDQPARVANEQLLQEINFEDLNLDDTVLASEIDDIENIQIDSEETTRSDKFCKSHGIVYIAGYILKKARSKIFKFCPVCRNSLCAQKISPIHAYNVAREYKKNPSLQYPSLVWIKQFELINKILINVFRNKGMARNPKSYINLLVSYYVDFNFITCDNHRRALIEFISEFSIKLLIFNWVKRINYVITGKVTDFNEDDKTMSMAHKYFIKYCKQGSQNKQ